MGALGVRVEGTRGKDSQTGRVQRVRLTYAGFGFPDQGDAAQILEFIIAPTNWMAYVELP